MNQSSSLTMTSEQFSPTYPRQLCVPSRISDSTLRYAAKYRSKERIPALTYLHRENLASISRSSQPLVGLNNRSMQDEKLVEAIFATHLFADPTSPAARAASFAAGDASEGGSRQESEKPIAVYGAQTTNLIVDARPTTNAIVNRAKGAGTENMEHYKGCKKVYLGIDNIHVMRDSLQRATDALRAARVPATFGMKTVAAETTVPEGNAGERKMTSFIDAQERRLLDHVALKRSGWLKHISAVLEGTLVIARNIHISNSHVLIHCSDGWDRTSQLSALAQLCLDPYYRTMQGFATLIEKDWVSFGFRFWDRCGHASSSKYFTTADNFGLDESDEENSDETNAGGFEPQAAANALWGFTKQLTANFQQSSEGQSGPRGALYKEISPVMHQFLDCVWQIMRQFPHRFEFNEKWLLDLYDALFECKYGTFLFNSEAERNGYIGGQSLAAPASSRTYSVWDFMLDPTRKSCYLNEKFDANMDKDTKRKDADMGVLLPNPKDVGFWGHLFRWDPQDINSLVKAEAEERKRILETQERQRQEDLLDSADRSTIAAPGEVDGEVVSGPVLQSKNDSVLGPEAANTQYHHTNLAYKARVRGSTHRAPLTASPLQDSATQPLNGRQGPQSTNDIDMLDTTNKMKNMFLGWSARLQDAYSTAMNDIGTEGPTDALPRVVEADSHHTKWSEPTPPRQSNMSEHINDHVRSSSANHSHIPSSTNPWASTSLNAKTLPNTLQGSNPWSDAGYPKGKLTHDQHQVHVNPPTLPPTQAMNTQQASVQPTAESSSTQNNTSDPNYDPLGVGLH